MDFFSLICRGLILTIGYLLGSIPTGFLAGKWLAGIDLRLKGSGSTGATNVLRHVGKWPAFIVFLIDVLKGTIPVVIAKTFGFNDYWQVLAGLTALIGHIWPIWLGGKGGKAVATGLGMLLGLTWQVGTACFGIFLTVLIISRIVSLSSITAAFSLPFLMLLSFQTNTFRPAYFYVSLITAGIVLWRHRSNLHRLLKGEEPKIGKSN